MKLGLLRADAARMVVDEEEWPIAMALRVDGAWQAASFLMRPLSQEAISLFESLDGDVVESTQEDWMAAVREHFSLKLVSESPETQDDVSLGRAAKVTDLLKETWPEGDGACLDCGCGSGLGSLAARDAGLVPISYDNDASLLASGLRAGRLSPETTMHIDGAFASQYVRPARYGMALMAGTIADLTALSWKAVLSELFDLTEETLVTVETKKEAELVKLWALGRNKDAEVRENARDAFFDRWAVVVSEKDGE